MVETFNLTALTIHPDIFSITDDFREPWNSNSRNTKFPRNDGRVRERAAPLDEDTTGGWEKWCPTGVSLTVQRILPFSDSSSSGEKMSRIGDSTTPG